MSQTPIESQTKDITLANGLRMRYYEWPGTGRNLVLLHPSSGFGRMWDMTARALGGGLRVFALDQRGHGDTDRPDGSYAAEEYAEDLHLFLEAQGLGRAIVVGHSLGGRVAQVFAANYPEQSAAIILVGGPHYSNFFQERERVNRVLEGVERMRVSQSEFSSTEAALTYMRENYPTDSYSEETRRHRLEYNSRPLAGGGLAFKYDKLRVAQGLTHMADDLSVYAKRVTCPVAIVRGTHCAHLSREQAERVATFWKDAHIVEVEGDFGLKMENQEGLAQAILDFTRVTAPT